jgi:hypothetical protein
MLPYLANEEVATMYLHEGFYLFINTEHSASISNMWLRHTLCKLFKVSKLLFSSLYSEVVKLVYTTPTFNNAVS